MTRSLRLIFGDIGHRSHRQYKSRSRQLHFTICTSAGQWPATRLVALQSIGALVTVPPHGNPSIRRVHYQTTWPLVVGGLSVSAIIDPG